MTNYVDHSHFEKENELDRGVLSSLVVESAASILDTLLPLKLISDKVQNVSTVVHVSDDGQISRVKLAMSGKPWSRKMDAKRLFPEAPTGSKMIIQHLDVSGLEFPPGDKTSLWVPSTDFDWSINKTNNKEQGVFSQEELEGMGITEWSLRVHVVVNEDPTLADLKWVAIPLPVAMLNNLPGDPKKPGYPTVALSDGEARMTGVPDIADQQASLVGIPFYPCLLNEAAPSSAITIPADEDIISAMCVFWRDGNIVRNMRPADWKTATAGPGEPSSDKGAPVWAWPPAAQANTPSDQEFSDPSEDETEPEVLTPEEYDRAEAERIAANARRELGLEKDKDRDGRTSPPRSSKGDGRKDDAAKTQRQTRKEKRSDRNRRTSGSPSPSKSDDPALASPDKKKSRKENRRSVVYAGEVKSARALNGGSLTSELLPDNLWPEGFDKEKLDKITLTTAMKLRKLQNNNKKEEDERVPGVSMSKPDKPIKIVNVVAGKDNATDTLHEVRFKLRPITTPPKEWWVKNMEKKRMDSPANPNASFLGASQQIPPSTFRMANDRRLTLSSRHFFGKNFGVETRTARNKTSLRGGKVESSMEYDYIEVASMSDMLNVITNYMVVQYFTWQEDYTAIIILKVANKYQFFRAAGRDALAVFNSFFNRMLAYNANNCHTDVPADFKVGEGIAVDTLTDWGYSTVPPVRGDLFSVDTGYGKVDSTREGRRHQYGQGDQGRGNGGGRGDDTGRGDDNARGGGQGRGSGNQGDRTGRERRNIVGKVPAKYNDYKIGSTKICRFFNWDKGCSKPTTSNCCKMGEVSYHHICAIITAVNGSELKLCGKNHSPKKHV